jgi:hypothetical protein
VAVLFSLISCCGFNSTEVCSRSSEVERQFVQVHVRRDRPDFRAEASDLVGEHAGGGRLDRVVPVVVVVAQSVCEVQDRHLADV